MNLTKQLQDLMQAETQHALSFAVGKVPRKKLIWVSLSHWGAPRYWTPKLIKKVEKLGLKLDHFEAGEETVILGVFKIK